MSIQDCISADLSTFVPRTEKPWNRKRVQHVYNRLGFGATDSEINAALAMSPEVLIDNLIDAAIATPIPTTPYWGEWVGEDYDEATFFEQVYQHRYETVQNWMRGMLENPVKYRMVLFWHNHFVTEFAEYSCSSWMWAYYKLLHQYAFGNFKNFVYAMGKNAAMLDYLDNNENVVGAPNENYARELLELFTLGEGNGYTQTDIYEIARALTGWKAYLCNAPFFYPPHHDNGQKTIFGQTGNWHYDEVHNLIFTQRSAQMAQHIAEKVYKHFVFPETNEAIIDELAQTLLENDFEIHPMLRQLFKSEHFFEESLLGAKIKSPYDMFMQLLRVCELKFDQNFNQNEINAIDYWTAITGQQLFSPINVAGWPGHEAWITEHLLVNRWRLSADLFAWMVYNDNFPNQEHFRTWAKNLSNNATDPEFITQRIVETLFNVNLSAEAQKTAVEIFKANIPINYYLNNFWSLDYESAPFQVLLLLQHLYKLPEFQLT
ncbi:MAG: DUF1800 domain-containing protein [Chitinophagales bacterium]|nr:DUF1800 domain-containing protein [Bacteroidota bacterium]MCB9042641.1 DUF1800 domain-containing protein [Chitinophagales bacterium]